MVVFLGKYNCDEILTGPEKVEKRIFFQHTLKEQSYFLEYFFDGNVYGYFKKFFGKEKKANVNKGFVYRLGIIQMIIFIFKLHPDILHIISYQRFPVILLLFKFILKFKVVYNIHGVIQHEDKYFRTLTKSLIIRNKFCEKRIFNNSDILLILSDELKKILLKYYPGAEKKVYLIENGIDNEFYSNLKIREKVKRNTLNAVFPTDIERPEKGFNLQLVCLKNLRIPLNIHVIGNKISDLSNLNNEYLNFIAVDLMPTKDYAKFLSNIDIIFSPSIYESFPLNVIEGMAAGVIPIISKFTGTLRFINNEINGFIIDFNDTEKFINLINKISGDVDYREKISKKASEIYEILSWDNVYKKYSDVYNQLVRKENINSN